MDVTGDRSKVQRCKEQYCIGTWYARSMNQGKLEVVKQEMARVNINILGIGEPKWTAVGEESTCQCQIPGLGRSLAEVNGNLLQYSCLENPMDRGAWRATVHGVAKSWTRLRD